MLTKRIIGEENLIVVRISNHVVWPVGHWGLHEGQDTLTNVERITRPYAIGVDILTIESLELLDTLRCACVDLSVWFKL